MVHAKPARELPCDIGLRLSVPVCEHGTGNSIVTLDSGELIDGVRLESFSLLPDDRGYFLEVFRSGQGLPASFDTKTIQVSAAFSFPGTIKAFHYHRHQTDFWVAARGMLQVALVDLRTASNTFGRKNTLFVGELRPWQVLIPPGVAHGYKVIGSTPAMLVYVTNQFYSPADEGRLPYDDPSIRYDWKTQRK